MTSLDQLSALIRHRRTIKPASMDTTRPVERTTLMTLLENATWAPTHGLTEPWRFRVYEGDLRQTLASALGKIYRETTPTSEFREDKLVKLSENALLAPTIVVVWMQRTVGHKVPAIEELEAVACAMQNIMLSAVAIDLGSFWSSPPLIESTEFRQWLGIGEEDRCLGLLYLGWPKTGDAWPRSVRTPVEQIVSWA
jgi:nitroreductase